MSNDASGGDRIPAEVFKILKDDPVKVLHSICQQIWKPQHWPQDWKRSIFIPIPKKGSAKECSNYCTTALISTPVFLPGESQGRWRLVGCRIWGRTESDTTEVT